MSLIYTISPKIREHLIRRWSGYRSRWQIARPRSNAAFVGVLCGTDTEVISRCPGVPTARIMILSAGQSRQTVAWTGAFVGRDNRNTRPVILERRLAF